MQETHLVILVKKCASLNLITCSQSINDNYRVSINDHRIARRSRVISDTTLNQVLIRIRNFEFNFLWLFFSLGLFIQH